MEHGEVGGGEFADAVGVGYEVVDEEGGAEAKLGGECVGVDLPGEIDEFGVAAVDGSGQAEAGEVDALGFVREEGGDKILEAAGRRAGEFFGALESERRGGIGAGGAEDAEPGFGATDITAEDERAVFGRDGPHGMRVVGARLMLVGGGSHGMLRRVFPLASVALEEAVGSNRSP